MVGGNRQRAARESTRGKDREQEPRLGVGQVKLAGDLRQRPRGQEGDQLVDKANEQEGAKQPGRRPDGGRQDRAVG